MPILLTLDFVVSLRQSHLRSIESIAYTPISTTKCLAAVAFLFLQPFPPLRERVVTRLSQSCYFVGKARQSCLENDALLRTKAKLFALIAGNGGQMHLTSRRKTGHLFNGTRKMNGDNRPIRARRCGENNERKPRLMVIDDVCEINDASEQNTTSSRSQLEQLMRLFRIRTSNQAGDSL